MNCDAGTYRAGARAAIRAKLVGLAFIPILGLVARASLAGSLPGADDADSPFAWPVITRQARPWAYWWWMGSAVDRVNLTAELQRCHDAGLGGVHMPRGHEALPVWI